MYHAQQPPGWPTPSPPHLHQQHPQHQHHQHHHQHQQHQQHQLQQQLHHHHHHHQQQQHQQSPQSFLHSSTPTPTPTPTHNHNHNHHQQHQQHQLNHQPQPARLDSRQSTSSSPYYQTIPQAELRIIELNKRLQHRPKPRLPVSPLPFVGSSEESVWWERFASDFFDEESTLTLRHSPDDRPVEYTIGRTLIPRFFKSYFYGGVVDLNIKLRNIRETTHNHMIALECDQTDITTKNVIKYSTAPNCVMNVVVHTGGHLSLEFVNNSYDQLVIKSWRFYTTSCHEYIDRSMTASSQQLHNALFVEPVTRHGLTKSTISYLKMCMIMEPMQELMSHHKQTNWSARLCLRQLLYDKYNLRSFDDYRPSPQPSFDRYNVKSPIVEDYNNRVQPQPRRRKRKPAGETTGSVSNKKTNKVNNANNTNSNAIINSNGSVGSNNIIGDNNINNSLMSPSDVSASGTPELPLNEQDVFLLIVSDSKDKRKKKKPTNVADSSNSSTPKKTKLSSTTAPTTPQSTSPNNMSSCGSTPPLNAIVVGELSHMGTQYQDENERSISRVENPNHEHLVQEPNKQAGFKTEHEDTTTVHQDGKLATIQVNQTNEKSRLDTTQNSSDMVKVEDETTLIETNANLSKPDVEVETNHVKADCNTLKKVDRPKEEIVRQVSPEEPSVEKENNSFALNGESNVTNSNASLSENHYDIMNSIPEERADSIRSASCDSIVSKLTPNSTTKITLASNGTNKKQNRRRSSERKDSLREGLMRTSDFVIAFKDLQYENPSLWKITNPNLLQHFEPKIQNGVVLYELTHSFGGWNPEIMKDYIGVDVKLTTHSRNHITVEKLLLNFQKLEDADSFYDKHFVIYLQIIISTALDPNFWESIENEPKHHDYFYPSRRIIEDIIKRFKAKLATKLKLNETSLKNIEKYPNLVIKPVDLDEKEQPCRACNKNLSTQKVTFENRSYDLHSYKPVKIASETPDDKSLINNVCDTCIEIVKHYSEIHHMGWKLFNKAKKKVELHRIKGKPINTILDECLKDEQWLNTIYAERDALWSKVEHFQ